MATRTNITQKTALKQHLTPQQVQYVRLLEMNGPEIEEAIRNELADNPALETADTESKDTDGEFSSDSENEFSETAWQMQAADYGDEDETPAYLLRVRNYAADDNRSTLIEQHGQGETLIDSLNSQLDMVDANPRDVAFARYLIGNLDTNGRLTRSLTDIANDIAIRTGIPVSRQDLLPALDIIRYQLDPPGLGAVDLRECLLIQLRRRSPKTVPLKAAEEIIENYFDLFTKKHFERLQSALGIDKATMTAAVDIIRSLDPKPGSSITDSDIDRTGHITADFFVTPLEDHPGFFSVTLNQHIPELVVEESFRADGGDEASRLFIRSKRDEANTFIGLIRRRSETLLTVMKAIVSLQKDFFMTEDPATLRPMRLSDLSRITGLDKSVISRATSNKYVATPSSIYPLKYFFNDNPTFDNDTSSSEILAELQNIIENEDKRHPLSDRALADALKSRGYPLARRTITKYREKNGIPVARLRKAF